MGGNSLSVKQDSSSTITNNNNGKRSTSVNNQYRNKKQPCMWNLDFTPYNSPLIRIK